MNMKPKTIDQLKQDLQVINDKITLFEQNYHERYASILDNFRIQKQQLEMKIQALESIQTSEPTPTTNKVKPDSRTQKLIDEIEFDMIRIKSLTENQRLEDVSKTSLVLLKRKFEELQDRKNLLAKSGKEFDLPLWMNDIEVMTKSVKSDDKLLNNEYVGFTGGEDSEE